jgi:hypothetical protein
MDFVERVAAFLRASKGRGFCDNCLRIRAKLARPQLAHEAGTALAASDEFLRAEAHCSGCGGMKTVTWAK